MNNLVELLVVTRKEKIRLEEQVRLQQAEISSKDSAIVSLWSENEQLKQDNEKLINQNTNLRSLHIVYDDLKTKRRTVKLTRGEEGLFGIQVIGTSIKKTEGEAVLNGILSGDQILAINGVNVEALSHEDIHKLISESGNVIELVLRYNPERLEDLDRTWRISADDLVDWKKDEKSAVRRPSIFKSFIATIKKYFGKITKGHRIEAKNKDEERNDESALKAKIDKALEIKESDMNVRTVQFRKGGKGLFGIKLMGAIVSRAIGNAALNGVQRGDQLVSINGINVETLSRDEIAAIGKNATGVITVVARFNPERLRDYTFIVR